MEKESKIKRIALLKLTIAIVIVLLLVIVIVVVALNKDEIFNSQKEKSIEMTDSNNNEWVWVKVPKEIYVTATNSTDYTNIEKDMKTYVGELAKKPYTDERIDYYVDEWQDGTGLTETEYIENKNKMLKSVYEKEGFWISKYEIGRETQRKDENDSIEGEENKPLSQKNKYVYNKVKLEQAQTLASQMATEEEQTSSLLYGIQWDLTLKYIEENSHLTEKDLIRKSSSWGNYKNRLEKTGMVKKASVLGIYDLAGNEQEWTLEKEVVKSSPLTKTIDFQFLLARGGDCIGNGSLSGYGGAHSTTAASRNRAVNTAGFRVTLF